MIPTGLVVSTGVLLALLSIMSLALIADSRKRESRLRRTVNFAHACDVSPPDVPGDDEYLGEIHNWGVSAFMSLLEREHLGNQDLVEVVRVGLSSDSLKFLADHTGVAESDLSRYLYIPEEQLGMPRLGMFESERLLRMAHIFDLVVDLHGGDVAEASDWMQSPKCMLGELTPLEVVGSEVGARNVENLVERRRKGWVL
ncbi:antitoxin Xre/MbcA/ParS toxin-binding domain-containing protein [Spongiibacter tropicus]|uniref:antitoxin Xre/MbcA/ParS toxin-binding domain-containing protein n=1 Tax=Spongiibacter tropicus TaxID=454602 RepID=UPI0035BE33D1